jgi:hypothetical protein
MDGVPRGREIQAYLNNAAGVESFVIIDDDDDMEHLKPHLILTPFEIGLTEADADRAIAMLTDCEDVLISASSAAHATIQVGPTT